MDSSMLIGQVCGQGAYLEFVSSGNMMLVQFKTKSHLPAKGFKAEYTFVPVITPPANTVGYHSTFPFGYTTAKYGHHNYAHFGKSTN